MAKKFYETDRGKIVNNLVHDTVGGISLASGNLRLIQHALSNETFDKDELLSFIERGLNGCKRANEAIDFGYSKIKELENLED
jgi:hypothetical protein